MRRVVLVPVPGGRSIYVEVDEAQIVAAAASGRVGAPNDLPEGAEPVGMRDKVVDTLQALRENIAILAETVHSSLCEHPPEEWSLELTIGFKGSFTPVPVILSGESQSGIKVTAKWKKLGTSS